MRWRNAVSAFPSAAVISDAVMRAFPCRASVPCLGVSHGVLPWRVVRLRECEHCKTCIAVM
jgi:hypothetical protein